MNNWTIGRRLGAGFAALVLLTGCMAAVFLFTLSRINRSVTAISQDNIPGVILSNSIHKDVLTYRVMTLRHIASQDYAEMKQIDAECDAIAQRVAGDFAKYEKTIVTAEDRAKFDLLPAGAAAQRRGQERRGLRGHQRLPRRLP